MNTRPDQSMQISPPCVYYPRGLCAHLRERETFVEIVFLSPNMAPYHDGPTFQMPVEFMDRARMAVRAFNAAMDGARIPKPADPVPVPAAADAETIDA